MRLPNPTYANVMSTIAAFLALGGTSYAVARLPAGSIGERELKAGAVTSPKIKDGTISRADLADDAILAGARGPRGATGPAGPQGDRGPAGPSKLVVRRRDGRVYLDFPVTSQVDVLTLQLPSAGNWLLRTETQVGYFADTAVADYFDCRYVIGGLTEPPGRQKGVYVGTTAAAVNLAQESHTAVASVAGPTSVAFRCNHISNLPASGLQPFFERTVMTAQLVDGVDYQEIN